MHATLASTSSAPAATFWERLAWRIAGDAQRQRLWAWLGPLLVTLLAGAIRLIDLAHPHALVFDETYYVKDAWTLLHLGYEGKWPSSPDPRFLAGETMIFTGEGSFVVHPPLGKWLIALGLTAFGADTGWGWRIATALCGTLMVLVLIFVAQRLTGSLAWGLAAGTLLALDGLGIVLSRVALLDGFLALFVLLAFWFVLIDRERSRTTLAMRIADAEGTGDTVAPAPAWGPVLAARPWAIAAGLALGGACAVKWSGLWVLAAFGVYLVVADALDRRRAGVTLWPAAAVLRQAPVTFVLLVVPALAVYLVSWTGWLVTAGGYDRQSDPNPLVAFWNYHSAIYRFHVGLTSGHSYASPAWQWPLMLRPTAMYWKKTDEGMPGCTYHSGCAEAITSIANPVTWYGGMIAIIVLAVLFVLAGRRLRRVDGRLRFTGTPAQRSAGTALVLTALAATYLPWLAYPERTIFQFYTVVMIPFVILALVIVLRWVAQGLPATETGQLVAEHPDTDMLSMTDDRLARRAAGQWCVAAFLALVVLFAAFWLPLWTGIPVPYWFWQLHTPIQGWI
ncbi:phospholipid carrier-dependent glycosyltransferase [uncultured Microbacterium sp.]|uniref:dolichyl-phosphate-mannose--protein mannosyltransferase n=1 Tax=uncultured Microbacterium sp. TaxID=191216 RepID=UPI0025D3850D|nr:phospholipid carrier-dependent glycosyltransferase [uncultured Microbacterium sp.]